MATITAANSIYMLVIPLLFPVPQQLQGYSADDVFTTDPVEPVEVMMGVDGILSGGWTPTPKPQSISLQADSQSNLIFDTWFSAQQAANDAYIAQATITLPSINRQYVCTRGFLTSYQAIPSVRRVLQPRQFRITWESIVGAAL